MSNCDRAYEMGIIIINNPRKKGGLMIPFFISNEKEWVHSEISPNSYSILLYSIKLDIQHSKMTIESIRGSLAKWIEINEMTNLLYYLFNIPQFVYIIPFDCDVLQRSSTISTNTKLTCIDLDCCVDCNRFTIAINRCFINLKPFTIHCCWLNGMRIFPQIHFVNYSFP